MTDARPSAPATRFRLIVAVVGVAVLVLALALYAARKVIAREALVGWLQSRGIQADADVYAIGPHGFTGRLRIGDPDRPDFTAERAEVVYRIKGFGVEVRSVTLRQPVLRASLRGGKFSVGSLDPLLEEFRRRPPKPEARKPRIEVVGGLLMATTDYGPLALRANALVNDGRLMSLDARSAPARLAADGFAADLGAGTARVRTVGPRVQLALELPVTQARTDTLAARGALLKIRAVAPYPDLQRRRGDGDLVVNANLAGREIGVGVQKLRDAQLSAAFTGRSTGWISDLSLTGEGVADLRAGAAMTGAAQAGGLRAAATLKDLRWTRAGGDAASAVLRLVGGADDLAAADLRVRNMTAALAGSVEFSRTGLTADLTGSAGGHGAWTGLGGPVAGDSAEIRAVKRAARGFRIAAPGLRLAAAPMSLTFGLPQPVRLVPDTGGQAVLSPRGAAPLLSPNGGAFRLTVAGGGLPRVDADVTRLILANGAVTASGRVRAGLGIGPIEGAEVDASGVLRMAGGTVRFTSDSCAAVKARHVELGENDVEALSGRFCPTGEPLLTFGGGDWRIAGRARDAAASGPFLQARVTAAHGRIVFGQARGRMFSTARITDAVVTDAAPATRFNPLHLTGAAQLVRDVWTSDLTVRGPGAAALAKVALRHESLTGRGGVQIDTGLLTFAEGGLQPAQLSPLAAAIGSPATGQARFTGAFDWTAAGAASHGTLSVPRLDFNSPAGRVTGLSGDIVFTSLAPLIAAPGQVLRAEGVAALLPLANVTATFALDAKALVVSGGEAEVGGGRVRIETLQIPLTPETPTRGVLLFEGVQLHDLVEASPFGDRVDLDARVSGRVPFEAIGQKVRIAGGDLRAIQPGRLSVSRTALSDVAATGATDLPTAAAAGTDTFTDFAYQAMEHLAFDTLDAAINSRDDGRLGVLFHVIGRHDPPQHQEIRLSWIDLIKRRFMERPLPLPSGTGVNLTLDTTLNLDDLLVQYSEYQKLRSSPQVQP